ncbi:G8 domain-containing protein [Thalassospira alkalitolerans]|uniref:G8 domain-containing protein n=1 Tax=Thalassospira alkalitolerans TaxID=1293890 RepID=UPI000A1DC235|nr:G8 domain-containing protein [Thalassospira alkalitolerans]
MFTQLSAWSPASGKIPTIIKAILTIVSITAAIPAHAANMSLSDALADTNCQGAILAKYDGIPIPQGMSLQIGGTSPCKDVVIHATDAQSESKITAPLRPVVIGSGGTLSFEDKSMTLYANSFLVKDGGQMLAGSRGAPIQNKIKIVMAGNLSVSPAPKAIGPSPIVTTTNATPNSRDITVMDGGKIALFGGHGLSAWPDGINNNPKASPAFINTHQGTNSWSYLAAPAGPASYNDSANVSAPVPSTNSDTVLTLAGDVDWVAGDWISVATTSFSSHQTEIVQISAITPVRDPNQSAMTITDATHATPIVVTASTAPETGATVTITGVKGNTAANGTWIVTKQSDTTFALNTAIGNGSYTSGGTAQTQVSQVTLSQPLKHYHFGGKAPTPGFFPANTTQSVITGANPIDVSFQAKSFYDGPDQNYGIDERAEVALLSRNIKLTSVAGRSGDANHFTGGHLVAMVSAHGKPAPILNLVGVEIEKFGQPFVGRYPVHLHHLPQMAITAATNTTPIVVTSSMVPPNGSMVRISGAQGNNAANGTWMVANPTTTTFALKESTGNGTLIGTPVWTMDNILVQDVSVHHAYNKCFVAHHTANAKFYNNVCVRTVGQGVYLEDGTDITGNQFIRNHIAGTMAAQSTYTYPLTGGSQYWDGDNLQASNAITPSWYTINGIADTSLSGENSYISNTNQALGPYQGPDTYHPGGFWITNPGNVFVNNSVAGCQAQGRGYWIISQDPSQESAYPEFTGNRTHGCYNGIDTAPDAINNASNPAPLLSTAAYQITGATNPPIIVTSSGALPTNLNSGTYTVTIAGIGKKTNGTWPISDINQAQKSFGIENAHLTGAPPQGGTWTFEQQPILKASKASPTSPIVITFPDTSFPVPPNGATVIITGQNSAVNGTWKIKESTSSGFTLKDSEASGTGGLSHNGGSWAMQGDIASIANAPITITSNNVPPTGTQITISDIKGNTAANGSWTTTKLSSTTFSLNGSSGNGSYTSGGSWSDATYPPVLVLNGNTSTRSRNRGLWSRSIFMALHDNRFATNPYGVSLAGGGGPEGNLPGYWDLAHANVFAGMSRNNVDRYPACSFTGQNGNNWEKECTDVALLASGHWGNYPDAKMNIQGYSYYDGPARIENNRFVNFRADPTGIHANDPAARLLTTIDIAKIHPTGQLEGLVNSAPKGSAPSANYKGYAGDPATGWIQSNAQSVPPTQYIKGSIWDNVDFKHQVYDESVNMGTFQDGDKTTVILDMDGRLAGMNVACTSNDAHCTPPPAVSLNNLTYYATDFTVDEPHSRGPNNFLATSLMSPHRYATLNIESVPSPPNIPPLRVEITRDMPAYGDTTYPNLFLNGRGQEPIYEPFVMDRMGYTVRAKNGTENQPSSQSLQAFEPKLLFSYTDPSVKKAGQFFVNRIGVFAPLSEPTSIKIYRMRRQWGDKYMGANWPPAPYVPPVAAPSCDGTFFKLSSTQQTSGWQDCVNRGTNTGNYTGGTTLTPATSWTDFEQNYTDLLAGTTTIATFIANQTYYYDTTSQTLYFYMIEDKPVWQNYAPLGTCDAANYATGENFLGRIQAIKSFSNPGSVKAALDAACLVNGGSPQKNDLYSCHETGCAAYAVDLTNAGLSTGTLQTITNATTATSTNPIEITTGVAPATGSQVTINGIIGNTAANGTWTVTNTGATTFTLNGSTGKNSNTYTSGGKWICDNCAPPHPITRTAYHGWNQYKLVYATPTQQANGLPVAVNSALGNTAPPTDGTDLTGLQIPRFNAIPPLGNQVTYNFQPLSGPTFPITENFPYRCTQTPPWSPVNARGTYTSPTYPIHHSICSAFDITAATNASPIVITSTVAPPTGTKVTITGITGNTAANGTWTVTKITPTTFSLNGTTGNVAYGSGGAWQID